MGKQFNLGKKVHCHICRSTYYDLGRKSMPCPKCRFDALIPAGTVAMVRLKIKLGQYNDKSRGWTEGYATRADSGAIYLNCTFEVIEGSHKSKKFYSLVGLYTPKGPWWGNEGLRLLRRILNSAHGLSDTDYSPTARNLRNLASLADLDGIEFTAEIDRRKGKDGVIRNELKSAVTLDDLELEGDSGETTNIDSESLTKAQGATQQSVSFVDNPNYQPMWLKKL